MLKENLFATQMDKISSDVKQVDQVLLREKTIFKLRGLFAEITKLPIDKIDASEPLEVYGIDSVMIIEFSKKLADVFGELSKAIFFEYKTLEAFAGYLIEHYTRNCVEWTGLIDQMQNTMESNALTTTFEEEQRPILTSLKLRKKAESDFSAINVGETTYDPIVIVGMSGHYPKAKNLNEYWRVLVNGEDCITEIPEERWSLDGFFHPDIDEAIEQGKSYSKWGGFLDGFANFDSRFFGTYTDEM